MTHHRSSGHMNAIPTAVKIMNHVSAIVNCRYCGLPVTESSVTTFSYWNRDPFQCHRECKQLGERNEAISCQTIDADCNDCKHFKRGKLADKSSSQIKTPDGRTETVTFQPNWFHGDCLKFNRPTIAQPNKWSGLECFEHRRS